MGKVPKLRSSFVKAARLARGRAPSPRLALASVGLDFSALGHEHQHLTRAVREYLDIRLGEALQIHGHLSAAAQAMIGHAAVCWAVGRWLQAEALNNKSLEYFKAAVKMADSAEKHERSAFSLLAAEAKSLKAMAPDDQHAALLGAFGVTVAEVEAVKAPARKAHAIESRESRERVADMNATLADTGVEFPRVRPKLGHAPAQHWPPSSGPPIGPSHGAPYKDKPKPGPKRKPRAEDSIREAIRKNAEAARAAQVDRYGTTLVRDISEVLGEGGTEDISKSIIKADPTSDLAPPGGDFLGPPKRGRGRPRIKDPPQVFPGQVPNSRPMQLRPLSPDITRIPEQEPQPAPEPSPQTFETTGTPALPSLADILKGNT